MEGKITVDEMTKYLKRSKNNVAPGSSGFTNDFFKFFWRDIKYFVINAVGYAFENNKLSVTQSLGIISISPKGEKDKRYLTNWRPLTLLNTLYKLISGCIADRIKPVLNDIIHPDQKGFVAGRYIGEVVRTTYDILNFAKEKNRAGILLTIDFEKAYDSISFNFIKKCLYFFNFGEDLIKWVSILLNNFTAVINHCGNISKSFKVLRGCRQGDPIASYLFILCVEILAHKLRTNEDVKGFSFRDEDNDNPINDNDVIEQHLLEIYADDLTIFMVPSDNNLFTIISILNSFFTISGLKISLTKTKAVWFGNKWDSNDKLCPHLSLNWVKTFTLLGIEFNNNLENMEKNFEDKIIKIDKMLSNWSYRYMTPFGKITVIKSLGLSKLSHIALVLPDLNKDMIKKIEKIFFKFLWGTGKSEKVKREDTKIPVKFGGLGMPDVAIFWKAFKFSWIRRLISTRSFWPKILLRDVSEITRVGVSVSQLLQMGASKFLEISKLLRNPFWKQVFQTIPHLTEGAAFCYPEKVITSPFFNNPLVVRNRPIKTSDFPELVIPEISLAHFYYPNSNQIMELEDFRSKYELNISFEKYVDIRYTLKTAISKLKMHPSRLNCANFPQIPFLIDIATLTKKGCSTYYKILTKKANFYNKIYLRENKWHLELNQVFSVNFWENARKLYTSINFDNQLRWLQFQIVRNSLQTNYIVSHFQANVPPTCTYCANPDNSEKISHLFWSCLKVRDFLDEVSTFVCSTGLDFTLTRNHLLFGVHDEKFFSPKNYIILIIKKYIWITKFRSKILNLVTFKSLLKSFLDDLKYMFDVKGMPEIFDEWNTIYDLL